MEEAGEDGRAKRRNTKTSQLQQLLQIGASVSAVTRITKRLRDNPDLNVTRDTLRRASASCAASLRRVHTLDMVRPDEKFDREFFDPNRLVAHLVEASPKLSSAFAAAASRHPCSSGRPCVVWDEFVPGNVLSSTNARKTMVLSFSFLELEALA